MVTPLRILLVEDDGSIGYIIKIGLRNLDIAYHLDHAFSAEEGLEAWEREPYDVLLTDFNLRGKNGLELVKALRNAQIAVPIMLFTAYDTPQVRKAAEAAGVSAFMPKPFLVDEFVERVRGLLQLRAQALGE